MVKPLLDIDSLISVHYPFIHSIIKYSVTVWGDASETVNVIKFQKQSMEFI